MISRWALSVCAAALLAGGCCCPEMCGNGCGIGGCDNGGCGTRRGDGSFMCRPYEQRMADSNNNHCGTCNTPTDCCNGGIKGWLHNQNTCCKGCGDVYWGEWISDPPDCCDPCDQCGGFTGSGGTCCKTSCLQRLSRIFNGYRYCPGDCGTSCGLPMLGCNLCGGAGCDSCCGGEGHDGHEMQGRRSRGSVLNENWDPPPTPKPTPGKPIHKANTPHSIKVGTGRMPGGSGDVQQASYESWR